MNMTQKAVLTVTAALISMSSSTASATITNEDESPNQGVNCGTVSLTGHNVVQNSHDCNIHVQSVELIDVETFGITVSSCNYEFDMRVQSSGFGYAYNQVLSGPDCDAEPCEIGPWEIFLHISVPPTRILELLKCLIILGNEMHCAISIPMSVNGHSSATLGTPNQEYTCEQSALSQIHGSWATEDDGDDDIEIRN